MYDIKYTCLHFKYQISQDQCHSPDFSEEVTCTEIQCCRRFIKPCFNQKLLRLIQAKP